MNWRIFTIVKATIWKFATGNRNVLEYSSTRGNPRDDERRLRSGTELQIYATDTVWSGAVNSRTAYHCFFLHGFFQRQYFLELNSIWKVMLYYF